MHIYILTNAKEKIALHKQPLYRCAVSTLLCSLRTNKCLNQRACVSVRQCSWACGIMRLCYLIYCYIHIYYIQYKIYYWAFIFFFFLLSVFFLRRRKENYQVQIDQTLTMCDPLCAAAASVMPIEWIVKHMRMSHTHAHTYTFIYFFIDMHSDCTWSEVELWIEGITWINCDTICVLFTARTKHFAVDKHRWHYAN